MPTILLDRIAEGADSASKPSDLKPGKWTRSENWRHFRNRLEKVKGWEKVTTTPLEDVPILIDQFFLFDGTDFLLLGTKKDLYKFNTTTKAGDPLTPIHTTGTVSIALATPTIVTGVGTVFLANVKAGDWFKVNVQGTWIEVASVQTDLQLTLVSAYPGAPHSGVAFTIRQTFTTTLARPWDSEFMLNRMFFTTLADGLHRWNGSAATVTKVIGAGLKKAKVIVTFESRLVLGNLTDAGVPTPQQIQWSDLVTSVDAIIWDPNAVGSTAGSMDLLEGSDWILELFKLGDFIVAHKERSVYLISFVGGDFVFTRRLIIDGVGLLAQKAVINTGEELIFAGNDNFYVFNGISLEGIGDEVKDQFFTELDPSFSERVHATFYEETSECIWAYPKAPSADGTPDKELVYNLEEKTWSFRLARNPTAYGYYREVAATFIDSNANIIDTQTQLIDARGFLANAPLNIFGVKSGHIMKVTTITTGDGVALGCDAESGDLYLAPMDRPDLMRAWKYIKAVIIDVTDAGQPTNNLQVSLGTKRFEGDFVSFSAPQLVPLDGSKKGRLDIRRSGMIARLRLQNGESTALITINAIGFDFEYGAPGRR